LYSDKEKIKINGEIFSAKKDIAENETSEIDINFLKWLSFLILIAWVLSFFCFHFSQP